MWWNTCLQSTKQSDILLILSLILYRVWYRSVIKNVNKQIIYCSASQSSSNKRCSPNAQCMRAPILTKGQLTRGNREFSLCICTPSVLNRGRLSYKDGLNEKTISYSQFNQFCKNPTRTSLLLGSFCSYIRWSATYSMRQAWQNPWLYWIWDQKIAGTS